VFDGWAGDTVDEAASAAEFDASLTGPPAVMSRFG
jgi:hypothetical protein